MFDSVPVLPALNHGNVSESTCGYQQPARIHIFSYQIRDCENGRGTYSVQRGRVRNILERLVCRKLCPPRLTRQAFVKFPGRALDAHRAR